MDSNEFIFRDDVPGSLASSVMGEESPLPEPGAESRCSLTALLRHVAVTLSLLIVSFVAAGRGLG